jgi:serine-threonine kinase receptor-associated protein
MLREGITGDWIGTFLGHKGAVWSCVLNSSATLAATASADFSAKVWDSLTGLEKYSFQHNHIVRTCAFSHAGSKLATGGMEKVLRLYDLEKPDAEPAKLLGATNGIRNSAWLAGDTLMLTTCNDTPGVQVWDTRTLQQVQTLQTEKPVSSIDLTFCGKYLTTTDGHTVRFWDTSSLTPIKEHTLHYPLEAASYCLSKGRFAAGGEDMWVHLHAYEDGAELECNKGHHGPVHTVRFGPEGSQYASGSEDGTIRIWQTMWLENNEEANGAVAANGAAAGG